jgi:hypothetical protein
MAPSCGGVWGLSSNWGHLTPTPLDKIDLLKFDYSAFRDGRLSYPSDFLPFAINPVIAFGTPRDKGSADETEN